MVYLKYFLLFLIVNYNFVFVFSSTVLSSQSAGEINFVEFLFLVNKNKKRRHYYLIYYYSYD